VCPTGYALFILVNATLFIRPGEIVPAWENWNIYLWLILACAAVSMPALQRVLQWEYLRQNASVLCIILLIPAVVLSHLNHGRTIEARYGATDMAKTVLYFLLLIGLIDSMARLRQFMSFTVVFIAITALLAVLNYHDIYTLPALTILDRSYGVNAETGEMELVRQLQASGIFSDPNDFSIILVVAIIATIHFIVEAPNLARRVPWLMLGPLLLYAFALTKSRGGFLGLTAALGSLLIARLGWKRGIKFGMLFSPLLLAAFAGRQTNINVGDTDDTAYGRVLLWRAGMPLLRAAPFFGNGYGTYAADVGQEAHNSYVHSFVELGFFGGACFLMSILGPIFSCRKAFVGEPGPKKTLNATILAMVVGYAVGIFSLSRVYSNATYLVLGLGSAYCALRYPVLLPWLTFDGAYFKRAFKASICMIVFIYVFIRVVT